MNNPQPLPTSLFQLNYKGIDLKLYDLSDSHAIPAILEGMNGGDYDLDALSKDQKYILDIGAHVGIVSILLSKKFPDATIYALEPCQINYTHLVHNIEMNECKNIVPLPLAITADGRDYPIDCHRLNSGAGSPYFATQDTKPSRSTTLDHFIDKVLPPRELFSFVKLDVEGAEYEILANFKSWERIRDFSIELHQMPADFGHPPGWRDRVAEYAKTLKDKPIKGKLYVEY